MVIKGKSVAGATRVAVHLERTDTNEQMHVLELKNVAAADLRGAPATRILRAAAISRTGSWGAGRVPARATMVCSITLRMDLAWS